MTAHAGVVPAARGALYIGIGTALAAAVTLGVLVAFGPNRTFTGLLLGLMCGVVAGAALFTRDTIVISDAGITTRTPWSRSRTAWDDVIGARFALDGSNWSLTLDLRSEPDELVLLSFPPVDRPVANPHQMRKREQLRAVVDILSRRGVALTVLPEIATAVRRYW